jgi:hypothetical protein
MGAPPNAQDGYQDGYYDFDGKVRRRAFTSCQISAILNNASSRPQFSAPRFFAFDSFGARGGVPLVVGAFDAAEEVGPAGRDLRFFAISSTPPKALKAFWPLQSLIPRRAILLVCPGATWPLPTRRTLVVNTIKRHWLKRPASAIPLGVVIAFWLIFAEPLAAFPHASVKGIALAFDWKMKTSRWKQFKDIPVITWKSKDHHHRFLPWLRAQAHRRQNHQTAESCCKGL